MDCNAFRLLDMVRAERRGRRNILAVAACVCLLAPSTRADDVPVVAVAASLRFVMPELGRAFTDATGGSVRASIGSSGNLTRQIMQGAPFQVFLAADEEFVRRLVDADRVDGAPVVYAVGRLVLFAGDADRNLVPGLATLGDAAGGRIAIANPSHAPYGRAARETLRHLGVWPLPAGRIVFGENASQAAQFAFSGNVQRALLPKSLVVGTGGVGRGGWIIVPADHHAPLRHAMALLRGGSEIARRFFDFMTSPHATEVLVKYGFEAPGKSE